MKTKRSNSPEKRAHWKSARTERRGRFAHGLDDLRAAWSFDPTWSSSFFEAVDQDLAFRSHPRPTGHGGRALVDFNGHHTRILYNTADKSRLKWKIDHGRLAPREADMLRKTLHLRF